MRSILKEENRVPERTTHYCNTVLAFLVQFMSIWYQNNSPRSSISETPGATGSYSKASLPCPSTRINPTGTWNWGRTLAVILGANLCSTCGLHAGGVMGARWPCVTLCFITFAISSGYKGSLQQTGPSQEFAFPFFSQWKSSYIWLPWRTLSKFGWNILTV